MKINFLKYKLLFLTLSFIFCASAVVLIFTKGFNYGIDFTGGIEVTATFDDPTLTKEKIKKDLLKEGYKVIIQPLVYKKPRFYIRFQTVQDDNIIQRQSEIKNLLNKVYSGKVTIESSNTIGSVVGKENQRNILYAIFWVCICIIIYMSVRFKYQYGITATIALIHDLLIMSFFILVLNKEFTIFTITAFLTILGYSVNDTIILYDRIREFKKKDMYLNKTDEECFNDAINSVLSRTIVTSLTTLFVVASLLFFSQGDLQDLSFSLFIGIIAGTYSSIYIATTTLLYMIKIKPLE